MIMRGKAFISSKKKEEREFICTTSRQSLDLAIQRINLGWICSCSRSLFSDLEMEWSDEYGAFMERFNLQPSSPSSSQHHLPLQGLTFAVKDIFDVEGRVTGFGNPDWAKTHPPANSTAPTVVALLKAGATCAGKTIMDEMAYSINGENAHYGTPRNVLAPDRVPGGSSSGSAVAVAAKLVDFSLGTDTGGSVRVPASFCGILGFRPSHGVVSVNGVTPMAQSFDTVGWFSRDPAILNRVGRVLLPLPEVLSKSPIHVLIPDDCFQLLNIPIDRVKQVVITAVEKLFGGDIIKHLTLGDYVKDNVPSLGHFMSHENDSNEHNNIPSLAALASAMQLLQRCEFKNNHGEWVATVKPGLGPGIAERVWSAVGTTDEESIGISVSVKTELRDALGSLIGESDVLAIPTVASPPPELNADACALQGFRGRAFSLLSIAGVSGFCQVSIPLGLYDSVPVSVSLVAKHGSDRFLLDLVETLYASLQAPN